MGTGGEGFGVGSALPGAALPFGLVRLSPDGRQLSFVAPVDGVLNIWVGPTGDPAAAAVKAACSPTARCSNRPA